MKVTTDYQDCPYITAGKQYEVFEHATFGLCIIDDTGITIRPEPPGSPHACTHLGGQGRWQYHRAGVAA